MGYKKLNGTLISVSTLQFADIDSYLHQFSPTIQALLYVDNPLSERHYLVGRCESPYFFVIRENQSGSLVGALEIRDPGHKSQLYCWVNERFWGNGYFKEAFNIIARLYKKETQEKTISACVYNTNERSLHALKAVGFYETGMRLGPYGNQIMLALDIDRVL